MYIQMYKTIQNWWYKAHYLHQRSTLSNQLAFGVIMGGSRGGGQGVRTFLKNHKLLCFLQNTGTDHPQEAIGPLGWYGPL